MLGKYVFFLGVRRLSADICSGHRIESVGGEGWRFFKMVRLFARGRLIYTNLSCGLTFWCTCAGKVARNIAQFSYPQYVRLCRIICVDRGARHKSVNVLA